MPITGELANQFIDPVSQYLFSPEKRYVTRLYRSKEAEILVVCWEPGQSSSAHSHGDSESIVMVLEGKILVTLASKEQELEKHQIVVTPRGVQHRMANVSDGRSVTLHIYAPSTSTPISQPFRDLSI